MKSFGVLALAASASAAYINGTAPVNGTAYTTEVVTAYTTVCPAPTAGAYVTTINSKPYTISSQTTVTVTNCPCTLTHPVSSATAASSSMAHMNGTASATKPAVYTGAANNVAAAGYGLAALGAAVALL
ncbi:hypothetical protein QM012_007901 [Aureobasidium pullulans]|uniref:Clock-controlled protein 6 n=1 Tax=Aureobasidium pullulans TaxID=5580 RepID=A0ABR0TLT4_AURPU